ncbi:ElaB/YqjD/DUF883 family membrane-anchored ribosome-binding protein [Pelomonas aquatica]|jgi:ElaB/YqjD/DUF883 family membrane-anchored ribosome-binding protein|uniref:ElaB/YqjD/DUF883 family membrane-anchored ribosome-binding protein n=1 Tax=Pelomonas aquatica TaxID=431058 RepID=A0ABU1ZCU9_9BURK|nr:hypothetical protein [Pelomonas aquatica]MDR7297810.1 ElaB/YqjD/DUF883 family membrane-anchored ribosome-binding protein [Pelomonas aquatica]
MATTTANTPANSPFPTSSASPATPATSATGTVNEVANKADAAVDKGAAVGQDVLNRVVQGAHQAIDRMADTAAPAVQKVQDGVHAASEALSQRAHDARELGDEWCESLRCTVRDNPLTAVATALAVGVLIARLTR